MTLFLRNEWTTPFMRFFWVGFSNVSLTLGFVRLDEATWLHSQIEFSW